MDTDQEVTRLLVDWSNGDKSALDKLTPLVYQELRRLAHRHMNGERSDHTLQTTALVNEAYLGLIHQKEVHWQNRAQFFGLAARNGTPARRSGTLSAKMICELTLKRAGGS